MSHPNDDQLLLHAYGELGEPDAAALEHHLTACPDCHAQFRALAEAREALELGLERVPGRRVGRFAWLALPLAAVLGALLLWRGGGPTVEAPAWQPHLTASPTGGYVTGAAVMTLDSQLTRLEQRRPYGSLD